MAKPAVYLDTSIISAFWYKGANIALGVRRALTHNWWHCESDYFEIWTSAVVEEELREGSFPAQAKCIKAARRLRYLPYSMEVGALRDRLMERRIVPPQEPEDAAHLALCSVHAIDYLLTWNYAHMANSSAQTRLFELCQRSGLRAPLMVSPESIPQVRFGQTIRRKD